MTRYTGSVDGHTQTTIYRCLAHYRRRRILEIVSEEATPIESTDLAKRLQRSEWATEDGRDSVDRETLLVDLHHTQLPMLAEAGLLEWDRTDRTVSGTEALDDDVVETHRRHLEPDWDPIVSALADRRRRLVLSVVTGETSIDPQTLARAVAEHERNLDGADVSATEVRSSLHHEHLPALDEAGLLEYDRDDGTVTVSGHPDVEDDWFESAIDDSTADGLTLVRAS